MSGFVVNDTGGLQTLDILITKSSPVFKLSEATQKHCVFISGHCYSRLQCVPLFRQ